MSVRLQFRRGTAAEWFDADTILGEAEIGYETDTKKLKVGNGSTSWNSLNYVNVVPSDLVNTLNDYVLVGDVGNAGGPAKLDSSGNLLIPKSSIILEGNTNNEHETTLFVTDPTANRTITFKDESGTVALLSDIEALIDGAPGALNTLNEISAALGDDADYATSVTNRMTLLTNAGIQHSQSTTLVHGIADTAELATKTYADNTATGAANTAVGAHNTTEQNVHGISDTQDLMRKSGSVMTGDLTLNADPTFNLQAATKRYVDDHVDTHNASEQNVHGIADTAALATKTYADNTATTIATTISTDAINLLTTSDIEEGSRLYFTAARAQDQAKDMMSAGDNTVVTDSLEVSTSDFNVGQASKGLRTTDEYTNPIAVFSTAASDYAQVAIKNTTNAPNSSSDLILYASNGDDLSGYIDIGITAPTFSDPDFTITSGNDGYIFMEAPVGTAGNGNLVFATGSNGEHNHIVFAAGGLQSNNTQMTIFPDERVHIEIDSPSTSPTTGALTVVGGVGIQGDLNIQGNVDIEGTIVFGGAGTTVETANLSVTDPLIFTGDNNASDIVDLGFVGEYTTGGSTKYSGIVRDASDGVIKAFKHASTKPTSTVNFSEAGLEYSDLQIGALTATSLEMNYTVSSTVPEYESVQVDGTLSVDGTGFSINGTPTLLNDPNYTPQAQQVIIEMPDTAINNIAFSLTGVAAGFTNFVGTFTPVNSANTTEVTTWLATEPTYVKWKFLTGNTLPVVTNEKISPTEFKYLNGVTSGIQSQLNDKAPINTPTFTGVVTLAAEGIAFADGTQTKEGVPSRTPITTKTSNYTLSSLNERDSLIEVDSTDPVTITIPDNLSVAFPIGTTLDILNVNTGLVTIAGLLDGEVSLVTVNATPGLKLRAQWSSCTLLKRAENSWVVYGDLKE